MWRALRRPSKIGRHGATSCVYATPLAQNWTRFTHLRGELARLRDVIDDDQACSAGEVEGKYMRPGMSDLARSWWFREAKNNWVLHYAFHTGTLLSRFRGYHNYRHYTLLRSQASFRSQHTHTHTPKLLKQCPPYRNTACCHLSLSIPLAPTNAPQIPLTQ